MKPIENGFREMDNAITIGDADELTNVMKAVWDGFRKIRVI